MRFNVLLSIIFITIGLCLWFMPTNIEAYPFSRNGFRRCSPTCTVYCPCGHNVDQYGCPLCSCKPSNTCTGRHPNAFGRPPFVKSNILY